MEFICFTCSVSAHEDFSLKIRPTHVSYFEFFMMSSMMMASPGAPESDIITVIVSCRVQRAACRHFFPRLFAVIRRPAVYSISSSLAM